MTNIELIEYPIGAILEETRELLSGVKWKMSSYPLYEYIMPTTFLKMAGIQEQKMKCICWELASHNYDYRYKRFISKGWELGTCADVSKKNIVYEDLCEQIKLLNPFFSGLDNALRVDIIKTSKVSVDSFYKFGDLQRISQRDYEYFNVLFTNLQAKNFAEDTTQLLLKKGIDCLYNGKIFVKEESLLTMYNTMMRYRNKLAHNLSVYEEGITFTEMLQANCLYNNYYLYFGLLILIDQVFLDLFAKYKKMMQM